jgi:hypothetical protein
MTSIRPRTQLRAIRHAHPGGPGFDDMVRGLRTIIDSTMTADGIPEEGRLYNVVLIGAPETTVFRTVKLIASSTERPKAETYEVTLNDESAIVAEMDPRNPYRVKQWETMTVTEYLNLYEED